MHPEKAQQKRCNKMIHAVCNHNHNNLSDPVKAIASALEQCGFNTEPMDGIYCGAKGSYHVQVGGRTWLTLQWYKLSDYPNERWEINAYVN